MLLTGLFQTVCLAALVLRNATVWATIAGATVMAALSFLVTKGPIADAAAYTGYAKLPQFSEAYAPPARTFHGNGFDVINAYWGKRLPPLDYGPLWLEYDRVTLGSAPTFGNALVRLRLLNLLWLLALAAGLRKVGDAGTRLATATLLNPGLYFYFIIEAHNDILPIVLVVTAVLLSKQHPLLGAICSGAAGLMKIPFFLLGFLALPGNRSVRQRVAYVAVLAAIVICGSWIAFRAGYGSALFSIGHAQVGTTYGTGLLHDTGLALHVLAACTAFIATALAFFGNAYYGPLVLSFSALGAVLYPWYITWCLPYALRQGSALTLLVAVPALTHVLDPMFSLYPSHAFALTDAFYGVVTLLAVYALLARRKNLRPASGRVG